MMEHSPLFRVIRALYVIACLALIVGIGFLAATQSRASSGTATIAPGAYHPNQVCPDAWQSDIHLEHDTKNSITIPLREGCFGGYVSLPARWNSWYTQPADGNTDGYWIAFWPAGGQPDGPYPANSSYHFATYFTTMRLQGHGTVRFYTNEPNQSTPAQPASPSAPAVSAFTNQATEPAQHTPSEPVRSAHPIQPVSGASADLDFVIDSCHHAGDRIECTAFATNKTDAVSNFQVNLTNVVDDEGNAFPIDSVILTDKLLPGVPTKVAIVVQDPHQNVRSIALTLGAFLSGHQYSFLFKEVPVR